jgi:hypothetical protein
MPAVGQSWCRVAATRDVLTQSYKIQHSLRNPGSKPQCCGFTSQCMKVCYSNPVLAVFCTYWIRKQWVRFFIILPFFLATNDSNRDVCCFCNNQQQESSYSLISTKITNLKLISNMKIFLLRNIEGERREMSVNVRRWYIRALQTTCFSSSRSVEICRNVCQQSYL